MKKLIFAISAAALLSLTALSAPAQAQTGGRFIQGQVFVVAPPPPGSVFPVGGGPETSTPGGTWPPIRR